VADRSPIKKNLRFYRLVVAAVVLLYVWIQYEVSSGNWSYSNGQPRIYGQRINGKDEGVWTWYYQNGTKQMEGTFVGGRRNGRWTIWDSSGNRLSETTYHNDKLEGSFTRWYPQGQIESKGIYKNDILQSITRYSPDGKELPDNVSVNRSSGTP